MNFIKLKNELADPFRSLKNGIFALLYFAETISLIGDAFTWVGLALMAYQFGRERSAVILATALTLRVAAFIVFSPFAGVLADKIDRKKILYITHFFRMAIVACLPFITAEWQIYVLVFLLNVFNAFFTPTYRSVIPQIVKKDIYRQAVGLSTATNQLFGILGAGPCRYHSVCFIHRICVGYCRVANPGEYGRAYQIRTAPERSTLWLGYGGLWDRCCHSSLCISGYR